MSTPADVIARALLGFGADRPSLAALLVLAELEAQGFVVVDTNVEGAMGLDDALRGFLLHTEAPSGVFGQSMRATMSYDAVRRLRVAAAKRLRELGG